MLFDSYESLGKEAVSYYDDTDVIDSGWDMTDQHRKRIQHYINRAQEEIWYYRPWPWRMAFYDMGGTGEVILPGNFSNVGPNGLLLDREGRPWAEISYQDMVVLQKRRERTQDELFCIGNPSKPYNFDLPDASGDTGAYSGFRVLAVANPDQDLSGFTLYYEMTAPKVTDDKWQFPIDIPNGFHHTLLLGTVAKMQEAKGDGRSIWRSDFVATLAKLAAELEPLQSRMRQMPVTIGRMW
jgi:hypothetical protein